MNYGSLAATGGGLTLVGVTLGWEWLVLALGLVVAGALVVRLGFHRARGARR